MPEALKKMYGPLPLWGWLVVILGALGIAWWTSRNNILGGGDGEQEPISIGPVPTGQVPTAGSVGGGGGDGDEGADAVTNEEWGREAVNELVRRDYDPTAADTAVRKYLAAQDLNAQEDAMIKTALQVLGSPPIPLPPPQESDESQGPATNDQWVSDAVGATAELGHFSSTRQGILLDYLDGSRNLSYEGQQIVSMAINKLGSPPTPPALGLKVVYHCNDTTHPRYNENHCKIYRDKNPGYHKYGVWGSRSDEGNI